MIKPYFSGYQISPSDLDFLIARVGKNLYLLEKEIEKIAYEKELIIKMLKVK